MNLRKCINTTILLLLLFCTANIYSQDISKWELKSPLILHNYLELFKDLSLDFEIESKDLIIYFFDTSDFNFYKNKGIFFRARINNKELEIQTDVKFRNLSKNEINFFTKMTEFPEDHSMKCENDWRIGRDSITSCSIKLKRELNQEETIIYKTNVLFSSYQKSVACNFIKSFRREDESSPESNCKNIIKKMLPQGPIRSTKYSFEDEKKTKIDMEKWKLNKASIHEVSMKAKQKNLEDKLLFFKKTIEKYQDGADHLSTKTKWAFEYFINNIGE